MRRCLNVLPIVAILALLSSCASPPPPPPAPAPLPPPPPASTPTPVPADWRDAPLTPGGWSYSAGKAVFGGDRLLNGLPPFSMTCDVSRKTVILSAVSAAAESPGKGVTITTSFGSKILPIALAGRNQGEVRSELNAFDRILDSIAYSRGRFVIALPNGGQLILPAWPEVARVIDDCRGAR